MLKRRQFAFLKSWLIPLGIFALALAVRVAGLGSFETVDEPRWIYRSQPFISGLLFPDYACPPAGRGREFASSGLGCTLQAGYPGVTTMWGGGLGLLAYYWQVVRPSGEDLRPFLDNINVLDPALIAPTRLPLAVVSALCILLFYPLVRRLLNEKAAVVATLLVALNPFHVALSRVLHQDALTANFMILSLLCMVGYWLQGWSRRWLVVSAVFAGIGFLAKAVSWFMMPCAAMIGLLSLYYHWRRGEWHGWGSIGQMVGEGVAWGVVAWLSFAALFPAMWVIPGEVVRSMIDMSFGMAEGGNDVDQYLLGHIARDPGPLLYPIGWLLRSSPLEVVGLLVLPLGAWRSLRAQRLSPVAWLRQKIDAQPVVLALALFVATFLAFETLSNKKMVRFFLPAFPIIDILVALGLVWLADRLARLTRREAVQRWALPALGGLVLLGQGWLVMDNYPYYFTYYNPLLGGAPGAAQIMDVGWGEGLNEAAAYLNRQPGSEAVQVTADYYLTFIPFFAGEANEFGGPLSEAMNSDYLVFYRRQLQSKLHDPNLWHYFDQHYLPAERVTLQGLDYALIYRNPIQQHICAPDNSLADDLVPFGYNLAADGALTLFWQNVKGGDRLDVQVGLAPATGGETRSQRDPERWVACAPAPAFASEAGTPGALLESECSLAASGAPPGYYDLRLGLGSGDHMSSIALSAGGLAAQIDADGRFSPVAPATALQLLAKQGLVTPLSVAFGETVSLAGYRLEPTTWQAGGEGALVLYWQPQRRLSSSLAGMFELSMRLVPPGGAEPAAAASHPVLPGCLAARDLAAAAVVPVRYPLSLPATLPPGAYTLQACLTAAGGGQTLDCLPLAVNVVH
jgi:4-amino-4-deoxy-L-arabinose transferase-like glycosyltransferase